MVKWKIKKKKEKLGKTHVMRVTLSTYSCNENHPVYINI